MKVPVDVSAVIDAVAQARGETQACVARDVIETWCREQISVARTLAAKPPPAPHEGKRRRYVTKAMRAAVFKRDEGRCCYCDAALDPLGKWQLDHVVPFTQGGSCDLENLALSCRSCNLRKSSRTPEQWKAA